MKKKQSPTMDIRAALAWFENHGDLGPLSPSGKGEIQGVFKPMHEPFHLDPPNTARRARHPKEKGE